MKKTIKKDIALFTFLIFSSLSYSQIFNHYSLLQGTFTGGPNSRMIWMDDGNQLMIGSSWMEGVIHVEGTDTTVLATGVNADHIGGFMLIRDSLQQFVKANVWSPIPDPSNMESFGIRFCFKSPNGEIYAGGDHASKVDFDPGPDTLLGGQGGKGTDGFLMKFSPTGDFLWVKEIITPDSVLGAAYVHAGVMDNNRDIFLTGIYYKEADFDPGAGTQIHGSFGNNPNSYILKLDSAGNFLNFWEFEEHYMQLQNLAIGANGGLVMFGTFGKDSLNLNLKGGSPYWIENNGTSNIPFLVSYDTNMDVEFGIARQDYRMFGLRMMTDAAGDIYTIAQAFDGAPLANGGVMTANGDVDVVVDKWSSSGTGIWSSILGGNNYDTASDLLVADDFVYAGFFYDDSLRTLTAFADTFLRNTNGTKDFAIARMDGQSGGLLDLYAIKDDEAMNGGGGLVARGNRLDFGLSITGTVDLDPGSFAYNSNPMPSTLQNVVLVSWILPTIVNIPTAVDPTVPGSTIIVYPNPVADALWIRQEEGGALGQVQLWDMTGKLVWQGSCAGSVQALQVGHLPAGLYVLEVNDGKQSQRFRIVHP